MSHEKFLPNFFQLNVMANGQDKTVGAALFISAIIIFFYYTTWALVMPFVDEGHPLHDLFPPREYAIRIPVVILLFAMTVIGTFVGLVMVKSKKKTGGKKAN